MTTTRWYLTIFLAGGQVVSSRESVSRDPLSTQVGDRRAAAIACSSLCCNLYGSPLQLTRAYLGETSIARAEEKGLTFHLIPC